MEGLIARLLALTGGLVVAAGTPPETLSALRRLVAAIIIQADPAQAFPDVPPDTDPDIVEAAAAGATLAAERNATGLHSHVIREENLEAIHGPEQTAEVFGPFLDVDNQPIAFRIVDLAPLLAVEMVVELPFVEVREQPMLLPAGTTGDADLRTFQIPAGTVWLRGERLAPGAPGYAVLRVSDGTLELDTPATQAAPGAPLRIGLGTAWRLSVRPEPAPGPGAGGSDGGATAVELPTALSLQSDGAVSVGGTIGLSGFGDTLRLETPDGGPIHTDQAIVFPYAGLAEPWSLAGNRSPVVDLGGACSVQTGAWALPLTSVPPEEAFEAAHGGVVAAQLQGGLAGAAGRLVWRDPRLTASALGLEVEAGTGEATARIDLPHWSPAESRVDLTGEVRSLRLASVRDGADLASLSGGRQRTRWNLPRAADGDPIGFDGGIERLAVGVEADGLWRTFWRAGAETAAPVRGLALENLYLRARPPRALTAAGSGPSAGSMVEGRARLVFDVEAGEPMLPDPYAASWDRPAESRLTESALSIALRWEGGAPPELRAQLERNISFPEPRDEAADSDREIEGLFRQHLAAQPEFLSLLDLSSHEHHYGVSLETLSDAHARLDRDNRLAVELRDIRLLMQPQVHWEPVETPFPTGTIRLDSGSHGGRTLVGVNSVKLTPVLPRAVGDEILAARRDPRAALFSLPFGLRAFVAITSRRQRGLVSPPVLASVHEPVFPGDLTAARQIRLEAGRQQLAVGDDPSRTMPGRVRQTANLTPNPAGLDSVLGDLRSVFNAFTGGVPLHAVDLSGYGLSAFSDWHLPGDPDVVGVTQVRFDVLIGRTAYEMIQFRSILAPCQARLVRTIIMERRNSGRVQRFDSGWQALDDGLYSRYVPFDTGAIRALRRIRNIRILPEPQLAVGDGSSWQAVRFDADAEIEGLLSGGRGGLTPALDQAGYVQMAPATPPTLPDHNRFRLLFARTGPIGGLLDCVAAIGGTLEMRLSSLAADYAPDDGGGDGFAVAVYGAPTLPRVGQWSTVRIDAATSDVSAVDARRGAPVVRRGGQPYALREPADARHATATAEFGFLFSTASSRVLFPRPSIDPSRPGELTGAAPLMADPVSLVQASSAFPRAAFALRGQGAPKFRLSSPADWRLETPDISFDPPLPGVMDGAAWKLDRVFNAARTLKLLIDPVAAAPWQMLQPPDNLRIDVEPFGALLDIQSAFTALSDSPAGLSKPNVTFGPALKALQDIVNALKGLVDLPFDVNVDVAAGHGPSPSFIVRLGILFRIAEGPDQRIDIGVGKFYGQFELTGELEAALNGDSHGRLSLEFRGDVQQGIIPPAIYAGGLFRFRMEVSGDATPLIELSLGMTASIGGDLIKGLLEVEVTVSYGYTLIPQTLQPGVLLGLEARAKLLAGLVGFSFGADAMARIQRLDADEKTVRIFADIRVAASVQVAIFIKKRVDFRTQFEQDLPLAPLAIVAGANPLAVAAAQVVL